MHAKITALNLHEVLDEFLELIDKKVIDGVDLADELSDPLVHQVNRVFLLSNANAESLFLLIFSFDLFDFFRIIIFIGFSVIIFYLLL